MTKVGVIALLAFCAASAGAQPVAPTVQIEPGPDSAEQRQVLRDLSMCLARTRPGWARRTLALPYLSNDQATAAAQALNGRDNCSRGPQTEVIFRTSGLIGGLADHFLQDELRRADSARLSAAVGSSTPHNGSEDFARCVAMSDPDAARDLALSEPGSADETRAIGQIAAHVRPCLNPGERSAVDLPSLRALVSTALYRGVAGTVTASN